MKRMNGLKARKYECVDCGGMLGKKNVCMIDMIELIRQRRMDKQINGLIDRRMEYWIYNEYSDILMNGLLDFGVFCLAVDAQNRFDEYFHNHGQLFMAVYVETDYL